MPSTARFNIPALRVGTVVVLALGGLVGCSAPAPVATPAVLRPTVPRPTPPPRPPALVDLADAQARLAAGGSLTYPEVIALRRTLVGSPADLPDSRAHAPYATAEAARETRERTFTAHLETCRLTDALGWIAYWQPADRSSPSTPQQPMQVAVYMYDPYAPSEAQNSSAPDVLLLGWTRAQTAAFHAGEPIRFSGSWTLEAGQEAVRAVQYAAVAEAPNPTLTPPAVGSDVQIELSRAMCFGPCPDYTVTITGDGQVTFNGHYYTRVTGSATTRIAANRMQELLAEIQKTEFFALADSYDAQITDLPTYSVAVQWQGRSKRVRDYAVGPRKLRILEDRIDELVNADQWIK